MPQDEANITLELGYKDTIVTIKTTNRDMMLKVLDIIHDTANACKILAERKEQS